MEEYNKLTKLPTYLPTYLLKAKMTTSELVFIPSPGAGHLPPTVELAKLLLLHDQRLSITIILMNLPYEPKAKHTTHTQTQTNSDRLRFIDIPSDESTKNLISPNTFISAFLEHQKPYVTDIVRNITRSDSVRLVGFVVDMFCIAMMDVAHEFAAPTYLYFTSSAASLGLMFYLQLKHDDDDLDVAELKESGLKLSMPGFSNPVPANVLPSVLFDKDGGSKMFIDLARRYRDTKGIIVNTFEDLEKHGVHSISGPPVFPVGPILNLNSSRNDEGKAEEIMTWLNGQPERSVVFLCFGSMGSFSDEQVKEIAVALERTGERFLWSLRRRSEEKMGYPEDYENPAEVLPEGFLERTSSVGKVIGWAPQTAVLSHPSVGGFVSHCGWNSTLESIWYGVPVAAWPLYAEQQFNAFRLVVELGIATEIRMDYRIPVRGGGGGGGEMIVKAEELESGIRRLMKDGEMREKVKEMKDKSRFAVTDGGSSYASIKSFINLVINYK